MIIRLFTLINQLINHLTLFASKVLIYIYCAHAPFYTNNLYPLQRKSQPSQRQSGTFSYLIVYMRSSNLILPIVKAHIIMNA